MNIKISNSYGYVLVIAVLLYLTQQLLMVIPVALERKNTKIKAPTLYPRDSEIEKLNLTDDQVLQYYRAQRVHQNNVELMSVFMPVFLVAGLFEPVKVSIAGVIVWIFRIAGGIGYLNGRRMYGAPYHLGEIYLLYIVCTIAYKFLNKVDINKTLGVDAVGSVD